MLESVQSVSAPERLQYKHTRNPEEVLFFTPDRNVKVLLLWKSVFLRGTSQSDAHEKAHIGHSRLRSVCVHARL